MGREEEKGREGERERGGGGMRRIREWLCNNTGVREGDRERKIRK